MNASTGQPKRDQLTDRELEILHGIAEGLSNREIGQRLHLSLDTVKWYNKRIFEKLDASNRTQAVARARERGLLGGDPRRVNRRWLYGGFGLLLVVVLAALQFSGLLSAGIRLVLGRSPSGSVEEGPLVIEAHGQPVRDVAWSPDGSRLASASEDNSLALWDARTGELLRRLGGHTDDVNSVAWSPDGVLIASGSNDNVVILWDGETGELVRTLRAFSSDIHVVAWSPDGTQLASGAFDGAVVLWSREDDEPLHTLAAESGWIHSLDWLAGKPVLLGASALQQVFFWDIETGELLRSLKLSPTYYNQFTEPLSFTVALSPDESLLVQGGLGGAAMYDASSGELLQLVEEDIQSIRRAVWSPDGTVLALATGSGDVSLWNSEAGERLHVLDGGAHVLHSLAWSPDGSHLAAATDGGSLIVWDVRSWLPR